MTYDESAADISFTMFLAAFKPDQFSPIEWDIYQYFRLHRV
jgi:hypothetical protein